MVFQPSAVAPPSSRRRSRLERQALSYATEDGQRPLKKRGVEAFAPVAALSLKSSGATTSSDITSTATQGTAEQAREAALNPKVLSLLQSVSGRKNSFSRGAIRVASSFLEHAAAGGKGSARRLVLHSQEQMFDAIGLGAMQVAVQAEDSTHALGTLVILPTDRLLDHLASHLKAHFQVSVLAVDSRLAVPTFPAASPQMTPSTVVVALATAETFLKLKENAWSYLLKHCGAIVVANTADEVQQQQSKSKEVAAQLEECTSKVRSLLAASSSSTTTSSLIILGTTIAAATAASGSQQQEGATSSSKNEDEALVLPRCAGRVNVMVVDGAMKFQTLYGLIVAQSKATVSTVVLVHFNNRETALFWSDVLTALQELPESVSILCDAEVEDTLSGKGRVAPETVREATQDRIAAAMNSDSTKTKTVICLSAFGVIPRTSSAAQRLLFVQYDPIVEIARYGITVLKQLIACCDQILVLLHSNEAASGVLCLQQQLHEVVPAAHHKKVRFERLPVPSATTALLSAQQMRGLHKKLFTINQRAFEAYRASMHVYSRLHPKEVYDVKSLVYDSYAAELGFAEAPLLDLRTKANAFRPKEDIMKASVKRLVRERQAKRKFADEQLIGEGPEEHIVPEESI